MIVLEDRGLVLDQICGILEYENINEIVDIIPCSNVNEAEEAINEYMADVVIICTDLSMDPLSFPEEDCYKTEGGVLTGWVWLKNVVFSNTELENTKVIVFTDYLTSLEVYIEKNPSEKPLYDKVKKIPKGMQDGNIGYENLVNTVQKLLR